MTGQEKYADKIAKLLRKAESTTFEEAELLVAKAQQLMTEYAINDAMLDAARGVERDEIEQRQYHYTGIFRINLHALASAIARANDCRCVEWRTSSYVDSDGRRWTHAYVLEVTGFKSDLDRLELLDASLQVQAAGAMSAWWSDRIATRDVEWMSRRERDNERRAFLDGFTRAVAARLFTAKAEGTKTAIRYETERTGGDASDSVALVLRDRKDRVQDWYDDHYGNSLRSGRSRQLVGSHHSYSTGRDAGARADVGRPGVSGRRRLPA